MPEPRLPILLDATSLQGVERGGGIGTYTRNLLAALGERADLALTVVGSERPPETAGVGWMAVRRRARRPRLALMEHSARLPLDLARSRPGGAVFHNPGFHAPWGVRSPWVQTLHDVIPLVFDAPDQAVLRARWRRFGPRYRHADAVVAISHHAAQEGVRLLGIDPDRIHVAPHGVDPSYRPSPQPAGKRHPADGGRPYLLVVAEYSQRKGFPDAFAVADDLVDAGYPHRLVVAGRVHEWGRAELDQLHRQTRHPERIELRGFVEDLATLYQQAAALIMPSRYEGFGLPCLEAMACGTPVVSYDNSALHEVVSGGGILTPDGDVNALANAVRNLLDHPAQAQEWAQRGLEHAAHYTWTASATIHADAYHHAAARAGGRTTRSRSQA